MGVDVYLRSVHPLDYAPPDFGEIFKGVRRGRGPPGRHIPASETTTSAPDFQMKVER